MIEEFKSSISWRTPKEESISESGMDGRIKRHKKKDGIVVMVHVSQ